MKKLIINLALTGMVPTKEMTPHVPLSPEEIIADIEKCFPLGISMVHIHARDEQGKPTYRKDIYKKIIAGIREKYPALIIVASTSGRKIREVEKRSQVLELEGDFKLDMATLTLSSLNFPGESSTNSPDTVRKLAKQMLERGIKPELEVFDLGMVNYAHYLIRKGCIKPPYYFNILLGNIANAQAKMSHLALIVSELPANSYWSAAGIGTCQMNMNALGVIMGDGVRVGLEDNIWFDEERTALATNYSLIKRMVTLASLLGRPVAKPEEVRAMLQL